MYLESQYHELGPILKVPTKLYSKYTCNLPTKVQGRIGTICGPILVSCPGKNET